MSVIIDLMFWLFSYTVMNKNSSKEAMSGCERKPEMSLGLQILMDRLEFQYCGKIGILQVQKLNTLAQTSFCLLEQSFFIIKVRSH